MCGGTCASGCFGRMRHRHVHSKIICDVTVSVFEPLLHNYVFTDNYSLIPASHIAVRATPEITIWGARRYFFRIP